MKKPELDLNVAAEEFETVSTGIDTFYNKKTGEFDFYIDEDCTGIYIDANKFKDKAWVAVPSQQEFGEYHIMVDFVNTVSDPHKNELLCVALEGPGAFRRFKDTLHRVDLANEWYAFRREAFVEIARRWCEENKIKYFEKIFPNQIFSLPYSIFLRIRSLWFCFYN